MAKYTIQLPKSGKARNLASLSPLMQKGGRFESEKPTAKHRKSRYQAKKMLRQFDRNAKDWH
ncbi:hypothetical protein NKT77_09185 [Moraxella sp. FZLJ2107]|uniref:hypothetical protein n=1 Tax=unclassified Moraxella TaxID=2685852 RepID=UPI0020C8C6A7|nr:MULTISPECIES: hypothetical protein [unclassified Moraxella]UTO04666.1 hypothetical protein NKT77_09185 [Moraxella sp. FZLJ2107]UTO21394.1 hypothetical protein NKU06_05970 [Moraxella sp. FZLJ2109]